MSLVNGRRKRNKQRQPRVRVFLSGAECLMLERQAKDHNLSTSEYLRWLIRKAVA
jgi:hypothetical protein